ncbi:MAG TPA: hypothetical protein VJ717_20945 [Gemmatimonadaceae bacterium]|nr:hypothetical protein [Gemmatimonadaceae bacterium]
MSTSNLQPEDKRAALTGLIITAISLFVMAFTIVLLTNKKFAGAEHGGGAPAAETKH